MPRLSGLDLIRRVRAVPVKVPVILISGRMPCDEENLSRLLPPGVALKKPFSMAVLLTHLRDMLIPASSGAQTCLDPFASERGGSFGG